jgi:hypothetical protein
MKTCIIYADQSQWAQGGQAMDRDLFARMSKQCIQTNLIDFHVLCALFSNKKNDNKKIVRIAKFLFCKDISVSAGKIHDKEILLFSHPARADKDGQNTMHLCYVTQSFSFYVLLNVITIIHHAFNYAVCI